MAFVTLQTIFQGAFPAYESPQPLPAHVRRAARALRPGRTAVLGGHGQGCPDGHGARLWDHACRPRSCPPGTSLQTERGRALQQARGRAWAPAQVRCTLPHDLTPRGRAKVPVRRTRGWQAVRATLGPCLAAPQDLGAPPGIIAAWPPWRQT